MALSGSGKWTWGEGSKSHESESLLDGVFRSQIDWFLKTSTLFYSDFISKQTHAQEAISEYFSYTATLSVCVGVCLCMNKHRGETDP